MIEVNKEDSKFANELSMKQKVRRHKFEENLDMTDYINKHTSSKPVSFREWENYSISCDPTLQHKILLAPWNLKKMARQDDISEISSETVK